MYHICIWLQAHLLEISSIDFSVTFECRPGVAKKANPSDNKTYFYCNPKG